MPTVREIATEIVGREGGYVDDPDDPGGATNWGVTIHTMQRLGLDLTRDGQITPADVRALTRDQAIDIFMRHYFEAPGIKGLPEMLHESVFDMYVNAGGNAVKILQKLCCDIGCSCSVDGVIGAKTFRAAHEACTLAPDHIADAYAIARRNYYFRLADKCPASRKYARNRAGGKGGWIKRAEAFMAPRYHMTDAQFAERVAAWG